MRIDHAAFVHISPHVDVHRWHADHAWRDVGARTNGRSAGHNPYAVRSVYRFEGVSVLVEEGEALGRIVHQRADSEAQEDALLDPAIHRPASIIRSGCGPHASLIQGPDQVIEGRPD